MSEGVNQKLLTFLLFHSSAVASSLANRGKACGSVASLARLDVYVVEDAVDSNLFLIQRWWPSELATSWRVGDASSLLGLSI